MKNHEQTFKHGRFISLDKWREYENRKRELYAANLPPDEYERELTRIAQEVGV